MQVVMVMFRADGERRSFSLTRDLTVIGRREDCDLRIPLGDVSRKHCRVVRDGETLHLEDLGSSNGTFVNGQRVQEALLSPGDTVQIGPVVFCVQVDGTPPEEEMAPIFASPQAPAYDESAEQPYDADVAGVDGAEHLEVQGAEGSVEELSAEDAELEVGEEDLELEAHQDAEPLAEDVFVEDETAAAQAEMIAESGEDAEAPHTGESLEELEGAVELDSGPAVEAEGPELEEATLIDSRIEPAEPLEVAEGEESEHEAEAPLEDFDIIEGDDDNDQPNQSGDARLDSNRH